MNQTRKIVEGATLLAILGALMFIDIRFAGLFSSFIALILPIIIIVYTARYTFKDGIIFAITTLLFAFVSGFAAYNPESIIYYPIGIIVGILYSFGIYKNIDKRRLLIIAIISFIIGEIVATFIFYPLFGINLEDSINSMMEVFMNDNAAIGNMSMSDAINLIMSNMGISIGLFLTIIFVLTVILTGVMEGFIIHVLAIFLLKRLKIKDLGVVSLYDMKPNKILSYVSIACAMSLFIINSTENQTIKVLIISLSLLGLIVLLYYGYIFVMLYGRIVLKRNLTLILVILMIILPPVMISLVIIGFLYGSGPLRTYLERIVKENENNK